MMPEPWMRPFISRFLGQGIEYERLRFLYDPSTMSLPSYAMLKATHQRRITMWMKTRFAQWEVEGQVRERVNGALAECEHGRPVQSRSMPLT